MTAASAEVSELYFEPDSELAGADVAPLDVADIRKSKVSSTLTRAHFGKYNGQNACLIVFKFDFTPYHNTKFKYVEVKMKFLKSKKRPGESQPPAAPTIITFEPKRWEGNPAEREVTESAFADANSSMQPMASSYILNAAANIGRTTTARYKEVKRATLGSILDGSNIEWRLSQNEVTNEGIPNPLETAVIVSCPTGFSLRLSFLAKLSRSMNPTTWKGAHARRLDLINFHPDDLVNGIGPIVDKLENMEHDEFQLTDLIQANWNL